MCLGVGDTLIWAHLQTLLPWLSHLGIGNLETNVLFKYTKMSIIFHIVFILININIKFNFEEKVFKEKESII